MFECLFSIYMCVSACVRVLQTIAVRWIYRTCAVCVYPCVLCFLLCASYHCHCVRFYSLNCSFLSVHASVSNAECNKYLLLIDQFFSYAQFLFPFDYRLGCLFVYLFSSDVCHGTAWHLLCANMYNCERVCEPSPTLCKGVWVAKVPKIDDSHPNAHSHAQFVYPTAF